MTHVYMCDLCHLHHENYATSSRPIWPRLQEGYVCILCQRLTGAGCVEVYYAPDCFGKMLRKIKELKKECEQLKMQNEVFENHIKYKPGGEGEFKAMCSFYKAVMDSEIK